MGSGSGRATDNQLEMARRLGPITPKGESFAVIIQSQCCSQHCAAQTCAQMERQAQVGVERYNGPVLCWNCRRIARDVQGTNPLTTAMMPPAERSEISKQPAYSSSLTTLRNSSAAGQNVVSSRPVLGTPGSGETRRAVSTASSRSHQIQAGKAEVDILSSEGGTRISNKLGKASSFLQLDKSR